MRSYGKKIKKYSYKIVLTVVLSFFFLVLMVFTLQDYDIKSPDDNIILTRQESGILITYGTPPPDKPAVQSEAISPSAGAPDKDAAAVFASIKTPPSQTNNDNNNTHDTLEKDISVLPLAEESEAAHENSEAIETPPSILLILIRNMFSYKSLLSKEMPFIYGTEHMPEDIESIIDEQETTPDEMTEEIKLEISKIKKEAAADFFIEKSTGAQALIYHTHTQEAYRQTEDCIYAAAGKWRTKDKSKSVVKVGDVLQEELLKNGFAVLHDKTNHEPPELNTSYGRSLATMKKYKKENKDLRIFIDIHRDSSSNKNDVVKVDGKRCARVMFVVGMGKSSSVKPDWKNSLKLALAITGKMEEIKKGFTRDVRVKEIRSYNQYMSDMCMLIEIGHNANTLDEAVNTMPYLAKAICEVIKIHNQ